MLFVFSYTNHNDAEKQLSLYFTSLLWKDRNVSIIKKYLFFIQIITIWKNMSSFYFSSPLLRYWNVSTISLKKSIEVRFNRCKIFLLYFYNLYDINKSEKNFSRGTAYSWRTNFFLKFHHLMKEEWTQLTTKTNK